MSNPVNVEMGCSQNEDGSYNAGVFLNRQQMADFPVVADLTAKGRHPTPAPPAPTVADAERDQPMNPADQLFQQLLRDRRKISYIDAYEILVGHRPQPWLNLVHCPEVIAVAQQSATQEIQGLTVQLDALIVNLAGDQEPSDGHFEHHNYTREQWRQVFGDWPLL